MKFIKSFVLAFALLLASTTFSYSKQIPSVIPSDTLKTTTIKVKGINCSMDLKRIAANVEQVSGVNSCKAGKQGTTTTFEVKYNPALVDEMKIYSAIENTAGCENPDDRPYKVKR